MNVLQASVLTIVALISVGILYAFIRKQDKVLKNESRQSHDTPRMIDEQTAKRIIQEIESVDLNNEKAYDEVYSILARANANLPVIKFDIPPYSDLWYTRASKLDNVGDYFYNGKRHSFNPFPKKIDYGRINSKGQAILYLGRIKGTAIAEVKVFEHVNETTEVGYSISRWQLTGALQIGAILNPHTYSKIEAGELQQLKRFAAQVFAMVKLDDRYQGSNLMQEYLSTKLGEIIDKRSSNKYKLTSALANYIFDKNEDLVGLLYQSTLLPDSYNLALKPSVATEGKIIYKAFEKSVIFLKPDGTYSEKSTEPFESYDSGTDSIIWKPSENRIIH
ncbi:RES domain-containing protein [Lewinella sp. IMCC34183]|uniref:RES domain-containing protein n=1 Tax=Lewinella sp. IMCC34183 TaxID=2248762 RepID=UPI000E2230AE|nr:RES domain-containing protein [Lewinella sp. IMCC34183]